MPEKKEPTRELNLITLEKLNRILKKLSRNWELLIEKMNEPEIEVLNRNMLNYNSPL